MGRAGNTSVAPVAARRLRTQRAEPSRRCVSIGGFYLYGRASPCTHGSGGLSPRAGEKASGPQPEGAAQLTPA